jgi:HK97 family phage major capsid protein/HK97 family phage prohead protease
MRYAVKAAPPPGGDRNEFVMSDDSIDRVGDIVEASGWQLANFKKHPIALFNHDPNQVIGKWRDVRVAGNRLIGRLELAAAGTSALVDTIRRLLEQDILRAVSVGFRALQKEKLTEKADDYFGPFRFLKSELLECSLVSVPANPHALATAKGLPPDLVAEIFRKPASENLDRSVAPHGKPAAKPLAHNGATMTTTSTVAAKIQNAQSEIQVLRDALNELLAKDELSADDAQRYADLPKQIEEAKAELEGHRVAERAMMDDIANNRAAAITPAQGTDLIPYPEPAKETAPPLTPPPASTMRVFASPKKRPEYPELVIRSLACWSKAEATHERDLGKALRDMYRGDELTGQVLRAVTNPAMTGTATWAAELTDTLTTGFLDRLIPQSVYNQLSNMGARYTFGAANQLKIPVRAAIATGSVGNLAGSWVGEGGAKPVRRASFATVSLTPTKLAVISTFTEEMATYSPYAIESIIRQGMADDTSIAIDGYLIDAIAASATRPAGLLNGVAPITASAATPATAAMVADLKALVAAITAQNGGRKVAIMLNPAQALALGFAQTTTGDFLFNDRAEAGSKFGVSFIVSNSIPAGRVIAVDAEDFASATGDAPKFAVSTDATLHEEDTPLPLATGAQGSGVLATPMRSLFQTDAVAVRMTLYISWVMRRTGMVQTIAAVTW